MTTIESVRSETEPRTRRRPGTSRPTLCFVYSPTSGPSRRAEGFLAQVLQRRQNHRAFALRRINCVERPDLAEKLGAKTVPTLVVVEDRRVRARLEGCSGCKEIEQLIDPWLRPRDESDSDEPDGGEPAGLPAAPGPLESFSRLAIGLPPDLPLDQWQSIGRRICGVADASTWWLADWAAYGENRYGERYREAAQVTGVGYQTLRNYAWVARRFDVSRRRDTLSFAHHAEVAALPEHAQETWLDSAQQERWSRNELRAMLRDSRASNSARRIERLRLDVESSRAERWRRAAEAGGLELPAWIIDTADRAARS